MTMSVVWLLAAGCSGENPSKGDDSPAPEVVVSDLAWTLHPTVESLVYTSWTQDTAATVHVEYSFDEGEWRSSPSFAATAGENSQILVGIPYETEASWRVVVEGGAETDGPAITTGDLPDDLPRPELVVADPSQWLPTGNYLLTSVNERRGGWTQGNYWTVILDRQARVVWASEAPDHHWTLFAQVALTGDAFYWDEATYWADWDDGAGSRIHKTWLDQEIEVIDTPGLHHAWVQLPDGTLAWGSQDHGGYEALVERAPGQDGETVIWTCQDDWSGSGNCESNGLFYSADTDSYLYSFYTNNSIVEVDRATGESLWWAGEVRGGFSFDPAADQYSWQHGITYTDAGTLLVSTEWPYDSSDQTTVLAEYEVDRDAGTLTYVWGSDSGSFATTNGDAWRLANGNTLHAVGAASVIREVNPAGEDVWRMQFQSDRLVGRSELIEDLYDLVSPRE